jgi:hypothetical protein
MAQSYPRSDTLFRPRRGPAALPGRALVLRALLLRALLPALALLAMGGRTIPADMVLSEILFDPPGVDTGQQVLELTNTGKLPVDIGGYWLSFKPAAWQFPEGITVPAGGAVLVHLNRSGVSSGSEFFTGTTGMRNLRRDDSISLFSQNLFSDPQKCVDFVEWGLPGQAGEDVAVEAGRWNNPEAVNVSALREGSTLAYKGSGIGPQAWCIDGSPTLGTPNDDCGRSFARSPVRLNEVKPGDGSVVELKNVGKVVEDLDGKFLFSRTGSYRFPQSTIVFPGQLVLVNLGVNGNDGEGRLYTGPQFPPLNAVDSVAFYAGGNNLDPTLVIDYLEWGGAGQAFESQAGEAGVWPAGQALDVSGLISGGSVSSQLDAPSPARWVVDNTPTPDQENLSPPDPAVVINEVLLSPPPGQPQAVELFNRSSATVNLSGFSLCTGSDSDPAGPVCVALPPGTNLGAGSFLVLLLGSGAAGSGEVSLSPFPSLGATGDELALLVNSSPQSPNNFLDYLHWGGGSTVLEPAAVEAGIWTAGDSIDVSSLPVNSSIAYDGTGDVSASYRIDTTPSLGQPNKELPPARDFVRSDCNQDGNVDLSDPITIFGFLFNGATVPPCQDACDSNDDGALDISDAIYTLGFLFLAGSPPKPPFSCGADATQDDLSCESFLGCPPGP